MMKNSNLMTRVALTLLVMMLTATTAWAETKTVKYTFVSSTLETGIGHWTTNVSATGDVNKNYSVKIDRQNNGRDVSFVFSPKAEISLAWSADNNSRFYVTSENIVQCSYFEYTYSNIDKWTLKVASGNYYITDVKLYSATDRLLYWHRNNLQVCELNLCNNDLENEEPYNSYTFQAGIHAIEVTLSDTPPVYYISYELNGGTNAASNPSTYIGGIGAELANPTRTGYTFEGWYGAFDHFNSTHYTLPVLITSISNTAIGNAKLSAKWTANTYNVVYNANGGSGSMSEQTFTYDEQQNLSANTFTNTDNVFLGWNTAADGSGTSYSDGQGVKNLTATNGATVTLYAQWKYFTGSGTDGDPYVIKSIDQWNTFANEDNHAIFYGSDKHIKLDADISGVTTTVGTQAHPFQGIFDGNQKTLTVNINETSTQGTAPFREISGATIKNLSVAGSVTGTTHAAALVGFSRSGTNTIEDCNVSANVTVNTGNNKHCGGLVDHAVKSTLTIKNCIYSGTISNGGNYAGGMQGWSDGSTLTIENSLFSGSYTGSGLFHPIALRSSNVSMTSNISGAYYIAAPTLTDAAFIVTRGTQAYTEQQLFPCKSATILGTTIYYVADFTPFGKTDSYSPDGSAERPFIISDTDGWDYFCNALQDNDTWNRFSGMTVKLGENITVSSMAGSGGHEFCGTFDGDGHTLTVNINETSTQGTAPFREISGATIKNLSVAGSVTGTTHAAALVGFSRSGTNTIEDCNVSANVTVNTGNNKHCGGLVDHAVKSTLTIKNCIYSGTISNGGNYAGGMQGWSDGSTLTIENSLFSGSYTGSGLFHPIAVRNRNASMTSNINGAYYTAAPTLTNDAFIVTPGIQAYTEQQLFPCKSATILGTTIYYTNGDFTHFGKTDNYSPDGSAERPFIISNTDGWDYFCNALQDNDTWNRFSGMTVKLGNNITVTRMAGSEGHEFCGTFDGDGHTLTVQYGTAAAPIERQQFVAPFVVTARNSSPVFRNLTIDGNIYVKYADSVVDPGVGGLIGHLFGDVTVEHCTSKVVINSNKDRAGGFVGLCEYAVTFTDCKSSAEITCTGSGGGFVGWSRSSAYTIAFEGCLFDGNLLQQNGTGVSGGYFVGWKGDAKTVNINNCLVAPATLAEGESMASSGSATFCRQHNDQLPAVIKNSYYTTAFDADQGTQPRSIVAGENVAINHIEPTGSSTNYTTSGITAYSGGGIKYDGKFYYGKDDVVSLTLSHEDQEGSVFLGYEAKDSQQNAVTTLTPAGDNYKLTMPDDDVTVTAKVAMLYSLTLPDEMEVVSADHEAIGGKYPVGTTIQFKLNSDYVLDGDVKNGDKVLTADNGIYTVTVGNADITITATVKKAVEPNVILTGGDYTAQNGDVLTGSTDGTVRIADGASITLSDVTINGGIVCEGTATIILVGTNSVTGLRYKAGIQVGGSGTTLTIKGNGALTANGGYGGAGIGTGYVDNGTATLGNITIEGGSITAKGGYLGAGIGTGYVNNTITNLGTLTINDDIDLVDATGKFKSGISDYDVVYKHGESNVTENKYDYFIITKEDYHDVIKAIKYSIIISQKDKHGTVTVDTWEAKCGESVTITVTPDNGYMLDTIEVKDANGDEVELDEDDMSFTMPDSDVTITVTWKYVGVKGDVNGNGTVDISDVVALVNAILNDESNDAYDVSGDNAVDINDVVALVNLILNN